MGAITRPSRTSSKTYEIPHRFPRAGLQAGAVPTLDNMLGKLLAARTVDRHNPFRFAQFERGDLISFARAVVATTVAEVTDCIGCSRVRRRTRSSASQMARWSSWSTPPTKVILTPSHGRLDFSAVLGGGGIPAVVALLDHREPPVDQLRLQRLAEQELTPRGPGTFCAGNHGGLRGFTFPPPSE